MGLTRWRNKRNTGMIDTHKINKHKINKEISYLTALSDLPATLCESSQKSKFQVLLLTLSPYLLKA